MPILAHHLRRFFHLTARFAMSVTRPIKAAVLVLSITSLIACNSTQIQDALNTGLELSGALSGQLDYGEGVKQTLTIGSSRAAQALNTKGAYADNALYRIALPGELEKIGETLKRFGLGEQVNTIEATMNRAAEIAAGEAVDVFVQTVQAMSVQDALGILKGGENAATNYFIDKTRSTLQSRYQPIIKNQLQSLAFYKDVEKFRDAYNLIPLGNKPSLDLESHVINQGLDGLFTELAKQESLIREDPLGRGSKALAEVFARARSE